jgi:hypothetical protein
VVFGLLGIWVGLRSIDRAALQPAPK